MTHHVSQYDGIGPKTLCYIAKKSTWNTMNLLKLAVNAIHDATKLSYVLGKSILKWFNSKFLELYHIPGTFRCNVTKDFRNETIIFRDMMESSNKKILWGFKSRATMRVKNPGFMNLFN